MHRDAAFCTFLALPGTFLSVTDADWPRLGQYVRARRVQIGFRSMERLAKTSGLGARTLGDLERGQLVSENTLYALEPFLGWRSGSWRAVLEGGEPSLLEENPRPAREIDRRSVGELVEAGQAPLLSIDPEALRGLTDEQQAVVIREAQEHALRTARLLRGER